jgi:hypothetical protein
MPDTRQSRIGVHASCENDNPVRLHIFQPEAPRTVSKSVVLHISLGGQGSFKDDETCSTFRGLAEMRFISRTTFQRIGFQQWCNFSTHPPRDTSWGNEHLHFSEKTSDRLAHPVTG